MIRREEFPYINGIHINNCYTYSAFGIQLHEHKPFSHLIITGRNGSGKSTILRAINEHITSWSKSEDPTQQRGLIQYSSKNSSYLKEKTKKRLFNLEAIDIFFSNDPTLYNQRRSEYVITHLEANRASQVEPVTTATKDAIFFRGINENLPSNYFIKKFKQYLVNKKISQAFNIINKKIDDAQEVEIFFSKFSEVLKNILELSELELEFDQENFDFNIILSKNRKITFDILSDGTSAALSIFMDLFMRVDLIRRQVNRYDYEPTGIVLIDEPETHLHLELQEQIMPLLTSVFPNIQFIIATHSPAVIASIKNATVYDLTTKETRISEDTVGRSYSDLTTSHFGLNNDYSNIADNLYSQIDNLITEHDQDPAELKQVLTNWQERNSKYLSPAFQVKLEYIIAQQDAKLAVNR